MTPRLLVLACSATKNPAPHALPALDRYDGPAFRVLRKYLRAGSATPLDVWVLSAEHGLLAQHDLVGLYDRRMTPRRAADLRLLVEPAVESLASGRPSCMALGRTYRLAIGDAAPAALYLAGGVGTQTAGLRRWLYGCAPPSAPGLPERFASLDGLACIDADHLVRARARLDPAALRLGAYAALVGHVRVAPKWLVAELSGHPVSAFRTADALRVLAHVGVPVVSA